MQVRPVAEEDAEAVVRIWTEAYTGPGKDGRTKPYELLEFFEFTRDGRCFVAVEAGEVVGVVIFRSPRSSGMAVAEGEEAELSRLAVAERAQRAGVGRALVDLCTELASECGAEAIALWSRPYQLEAHRLYESVGYRRQPHRDRDDEAARRLVFRLPVDRLAP